MSGDHMGHTPEQSVKEKLLADALAEMVIERDRWRADFERENSANHKLALKVGRQRTAYRELRAKYEKALDAGHELDVMLHHERGTGPEPTREDFENDL